MAFVPYTTCAAATQDGPMEKTWLICIFHSYLPAIGRFLIVVTFLEDALRIVTQWSDQLTYLHDYRHSMSQYYYPSQHVVLHD
jgi:hypothetical protein